MVSRFTEHQFDKLRHGNPDLAAPPEPEFRAPPPASYRRYAGEDLDNTVGHVSRVTAAVPRVVLCAARGCNVTTSGRARLRAAWLWRAAENQVRQNPDRDLREPGDPVPGERERQEDDQQQHQVPATSILVISQSCQRNVVKVLTIFGERPLLTKFR